MIANKRRQDRHNCDILAHISYHLSAGKWAGMIKNSFTGRAKDISSQGIKIEIDKGFLSIPHGISKGDSVEVDIFIKPEAVKFTAIVRHVEDGTLGGQILCFPLQNYHKKFDELIALIKVQQTNQPINEQKTNSVIKQTNKLKL